MRIHVPPTIKPRIVAPDVFVHKFVSILAEMSDAQLREFFDESRNDFRGGDVETLMLELIEGHVACREISRGRSE